jgi:hypothetical protein
MEDSMSNPWFRLYSEAVDDEKLRLLAFDDRWHFIAILCCKNNGILDTEPHLMRRKVAVKLGLDLRELGEVSRRIAEVGLIDEETLQPIKWNDRQFKSDTSAERTRAYRDKLKRHRDVTVTPQESDTDTDTEKDIPAKTNVLPIPPKEKKKATTIPSDFSITENLRSWAIGKGIMNIDSHLEPFIAKCKAKRYTYVDWHSAFQEAVREDWAKIGHGKQQQRRFVPA